MTYPASDKFAAYIREVLEASNPNYEAWENATVSISYRQYVALASLLDYIINSEDQAFEPLRDATILLLNSLAPSSVPAMKSLGLYPEE